MRSAVLEERSNAHLKKLWLSKVNEAYAQFLHADERYRCMVEELSRVADSDGASFYPTARARQAVATAFAEYQRLLTIYHDLLLTGSVPTPDADEALFY